MKYPKMQKLLTLLLLVVSTTVNAQTLSQGSLRISGRVVSALTSDPVPYCTISYGTHKGTISDSSGYFQLIDLQPGVYQIQFQAIGRGSSDTLVVMDNRDHLDLDWHFRINCKELNRSHALLDIKTGKLKLFLQSADPQLTYASQKHFSRKYKVQFHDYGDLINYPYDCLVVYNQAIFQHLDEKFGPKWRKGFRPNVPEYK